ncbi:MAG: hypothetical protein JSR64_05245 [Nitrospira sp.]|nr:hypothetical protein [Nitrospira sp.]MCW5778540.1 hypothetical protein [Nitrospira sp.]
MQTTPLTHDITHHTDERPRSTTGICRIDHDDARSHSWRVTLQRQNRIYTRNFPDRRHGGTAQALEAAQTYRDGLLAQHPGMSRRAQCAILKKNNRSGVSGVTRSAVVDRRSKTPSPAACWIARWPGEGGTVTQRQFAVKQFGEWGAFLKAVEARQHGLACLEDDPDAVDQATVEACADESRPSTTRT